MTRRAEDRNVTTQMRMIVYTCDGCGLEQPGKKATPPFPSATQPLGWGFVSNDVRDTGDLSELDDLCPDCRQAVRKFLRERRGRYATESTRAYLQYEQAAGWITECLFPTEQPVPYTWPADVDSLREQARGQRFRLIDAKTGAVLYEEPCPSTT